MGAAPKSWLCPAVASSVGILNDSHAFEPAESESSLLHDQLPDAPSSVVLHTRASVHSAISGAHRHPSKRRRITPCQRPCVLPSCPETEGGHRVSFVLRTTEGPASLRRCAGCAPKLEKCWRSPLGAFNNADKQRNWLVFPARILLEWVFAILPAQQQSSQPRPAGGRWLFESVIKVCGRSWWSEVCSASCRQCSGGSNSK